MPRNKKDDFSNREIREGSTDDELSEEDLELLAELMDDFPEFEYLDDVLDMDDSDFYTEK